MCLPNDSNKILTATRNMLDLSINFQNSLLLCHMVAVRKELDFFIQLFHPLVIARKHIKWQNREKQMQKIKMYI
jgi:coproporphyrinogen III oxidase